MSLHLLLAGGVLLVLVVVDLLWTTVWVDGGAGPLTKRLSKGIWRAFRSVSSDDSRLLSLSGPVILTGTLLMWIGLLWAGWVLIFASGDPSLLDTRQYLPAGWTGHVYFVAYAIFTMGNGDFIPASGGWQLATSLTTGSGMLLVTLSITYVISVLRAVTETRSFASGVTGLGMRAERILLLGSQGDRENAQNLELNLTRLASELDTVAEQHLSYPILHYYHSKRTEAAAPVAVAILDDLLLLLETGVPEEDQRNDVLIQSLRSSIESYLSMLESEIDVPEDRSPPLPELETLREADISTVDDSTFADSSADHDERRRTLLAVVDRSGWDWPPAES